MSIISLLSHLPIDLGQGEFMHKTKGKLIAFSHVGPAQTGTKALDVGCGDGYWSEKIKQLGYKTVSVDMEREYPNVDSASRYESMTPTDLNKPLPFPDSYFDLIWCTEVIEHLVNYQTTVKEIQRILKPGGTFIITTPNSYFWLHYLLKIFGITNVDWQNKGHVNFFHNRDIKSLFPDSEIYGYFPYMLFKFSIQSGISLLSPSFVIVGKK